MGVRNVKRACLVLAAMLLMTAVFVTSSRIYEYDFTNMFKSGSVDIEINQYEISDGERIPASGRMVSPGETVSYIPEISNLRDDGYVRVRFDIVMDENVSHPVTADNVLGIGDGWRRYGEYFYLTGILKAGESSDVFTGIEIPSSWTNSDSSGFSISAKADVIQAADFTPDFESDNPWGSVSVEQAKTGDTIEYGKASELTLKDKTLVFTGQSGFEASCEDLFKDFSYYMAGGCYSDVLTIQNKSGKDAELYFRVRTAASNLNDEMKLEISVGGENMYTGNLTSEELKDYRKLKTVKAGDSEKFAYKVKLPEEALNNLSILDDSVIWEFKLVEIENGREGGLVKTGDSADLMRHLGVAIFSIAGVAGFVCGRRKRRKKFTE